MKEIYVKDEEMPKCCADCACSCTADGACQITGEHPCYITDYRTKRNDNCPLRTLSAHDAELKRISAEVNTAECPNTKHNYSVINKWTFSASKGTVSLMCSNCGKIVEESYGGY